MKILDSAYIKKYKTDMLESMKQIRPEWDESEMEEIIDKMIMKRFSNPKVTVDNNYVGESRETTLLSVLDWALSREPIIAGNGTFYKNQYEASNPIAAMLDNFLTTRKKYKKEMFAVEDSRSAKYMDLDRRQKNEKINANSYYGASGTPSAAFFSKWSGPATTLSAQSVISTAKDFFESFLADNHIFLNMTELINWCNELKELDNDDIDDFIVRVSLEETTERLLDKILDKNKNDREILTRYLKNLTEDQITKIYYKNNMIAFLNNHKEITDIFTNILKNVHNYQSVDPKNPDPSIDTKGMDPKTWNSYVNKEYFMDPNDPPENIKSDLELFRGYIMKYVFNKHLCFDRVYRLRNFKRRVVTVIDTDSNILSMDILINWIIENVLKNQSFGRDKEHNEFIVINTITYIITAGIKETLLFYGKESNIPEEFRPRFNMKNEFYFSLLLIGKKKKRYINKTLLREGNLINPPKQDVKGFDFTKSSTSEYAESRYMDIIKNHVINSDEIDLKGVIRDVRDFENEIRQSIISGERTFLPNGSAKEIAAYENPEREQSIRGAYAWNYLNPDNKIEFPAKVSLVKMTIMTPDDMEDLKTTNPDVYNTIMDKIFNDTTGLFVTKKWESDPIELIKGPVDPKKWAKKLPKRYRTKFKNKTPEEWNDYVIANNLFTKESQGYYNTKSRGLQVLAIPSNDRIPEWAIPYIDMKTMVNTIIAPFKGVLEIFNTKFTSEGKLSNGVNRKTEKLTNIVKF